MNREPGRPIPVRELVKGQADAEGEGARGAAGPHAGGTAEEGPGPEATGAGEGRREAVAREATFPAADGTPWQVRVTGSTRTGHGDDAGAILLSLEFSEPPAEELPEGAEAPPRRERRSALAVARTLDDLGLEELRTLLARSRSVSD